jgi:TrpR-related protein YerC/YecD
MDQDTNLLYQGVLKLKNLKEAQAFFRDLLTPQEIDTFSSRFKIARLLHQGQSYARIAKATNTSTTTVTRVALWLKRGRGGYQLILKRLFPEK